MIKTLKNQKGMTLVELLAVMVIVGIIAAISIPAIGGLIENTRKDAAVSTANTLVESARMYVAAEGLTDGTYRVEATSTTSRAEGDVTVSGNLVTLGYLESAPVNPKTKAAYGVAYVDITITNSQATYTVTLKESSDNLGQYGINAKSSKDLARSIVGQS